jgi:Uma2 family endonuclease
MSGAPSAGFPRVAPVLAVEVAGKDDPPEQLLDKADWYLARGVTVVWILLPRKRSLLVKTSRGTTEVGPGGRVPAHRALPGLTPRVRDLFRQLAPRARRTR